jgi:hypothetical protein
VDTLQDPVPQVTLVAAWVQAPAPLQVPVLPQVPLAPQRACGSVTVLATLAQVPALPATLQAMQVPQLAVLQQTPSTQFPLPHSWFDKQATPNDFAGRQLPLVPVQYVLFPPLGTHWVSVLHMLLQLVPLQTYGAQLAVLGVEQVPLPEQNALGVKVVPLQEAAPQPTLVAVCVQAPPPLQVPVLPQVPLAAQRLCGSVTVLATLAQVPALPVMLQAWQVGQLTVPQQTPSTQFPLSHSWLDRQATPPALTGRQDPPVPVQ